MQTGLFETIQPYLRLQSTALHLQITVCMKTCFPKAQQSKFKTLRFQFSENNG